MAVSFQDAYTKAQRLSADSTDDTLVQLKQDINTGYHMFSAKLARYYTRKQQFTDLIEGQQQYQTPVDCVRVMGMTVQVTENYQPTVKEVRSEYQWRQIVSWQTTSNWPAWYYMLGNDQLALWPIPAQTVTNGLRFYYQPQEYDLSLDDTTSAGTGATVTVTQNSTLVTASAAVFTQNMVGQFFQLTGVANLQLFEIVAVPTTSTLTLKSAFVGNTASGQAWRIGQFFNFPSEYCDAPMHYALGNYFYSKGNTQRGDYHKGVYERMVEDCLEEYSSSNQSMVITGDDQFLNPWLLPPTPSP